MTTTREMGNELLRLKDGIPGLFPEPPEQWKRRVAAYQNRLRRFDIDVVITACDKAADKGIDKLPSVGQLVELAQIVESDRRREAEARSSADARAEEDADNYARVMELRRHVIPESRQDQDRWIAEGRNPFARLARKWEVESKNEGYDPNRPSPPGVGERRGKEMSALLEKEFTLAWDGSEPSRHEEHDPVEAKPEPGWDG